MRKYFIPLLLFIAAAAALFWLYRSLEPNALPDAQPLEAVPTNAALIFETVDAGNVWRDLSQQNTIWKDLLANDYYFRLDAAGHLIDTALTKSPQLAAALAGRPVVVTAHPSPDGHSYLAIFETDPAATPAELGDWLKTFLNSTAVPPQKSVRSIELFTLQSKYADGPLHFYIAKGLLVLSFSPTLIEASALALAEGSSVYHNQAFTEVRETRGRDARAQLYVQYREFTDILKAYAGKDALKHPFFTQPWAQWSAFDADMQSDAITLRGFALGDQLSATGINAFAKYKAAPLKLPAYMPARTAWFAWYGFTAYSSFREIMKVPANDTLITFAKKQCKCPADSLALSWVGNEAAAFIVPSSGREYSEGQYMALRTSSPDAAWSKITELAERLAAETGVPAQKERSDETEMIQMPVGKLYSSLIGAAFDGISDPWATIYQDVVLMAASPRALRVLLQDLQAGKTLASNDTFTGISQNVSGSGHFLLYSSPAKSGAIYRQLLDSSFAEAVKANEPLLRNLKSFIYEVSHFKGNLYFNNLHLGHNPAALLESNTLWEAELSANIIMPPVLLQNHYTGMLETIVQDDSYRVALFSESGEQLWSMVADGPVSSKVQQVDIYKNGKLQILFSTERSIYLLDRNGSNVESFPVRLPVRATCGVNALDYDRNRDYRFFIGVNGGYILAFDTKGKEVRGWEFRDSEADIAHEIRHLKVKSKDYIMAINAAGKVHLLDRQGKARHKISTETEGMAHGLWYLEPSQSHIAASALYYVDTLGASHRFRFDGRFDRFDLGKGRPVDYLFTDLSGNGVPDCVALWADVVTASDINGVLLWSYQISDGSGRSLSEITLPEKGKGIAVASSEPPKIVVLQAGGAALESSPFYGSASPAAGDIAKNGRVRLVTAQGRQLFCYPLD